MDSDDQSDFASELGQIWEQHMAAAARYRLALNVFTHCPRECCGVWLSYEPDEDSKSARAACPVCGDTFVLRVR
jgi:hypothetical protein